MASVHRRGDSGCAPGQRSQGAASSGRSEATSRISGVSSLDILSSLASGTSGSPNVV